MIFFPGKVYTGRVKWLKFRILGLVITHFVEMFLYLNFNVLAIVYLLVFYRYIQGLTFVFFTDTFKK